jgi:mercuric ion binding protein
MRKTLALLALLPFAAAAHAAERTATFSVPGMTCTLCPLTVETAIGGVAGVRTVSAQFDTKSAVAVFDDSVTTAEAIAEASASAGYPATLVSVK